MKIVGIVGVLRPRAYVRRLLDAVTLELPQPADVELWDGLESIPPVGGPLPPEAAELCRVLAAADGLLIVAPGHSALPIQLTHALHWAASPSAGGALVGKPAAVITSCVSPHEAMWAQTELHRLLGMGGAVVHGTDLAVSAVARQFNAIGRLADPVARDRVRSVLRMMHASARGALEVKAACRVSGLVAPASPAAVPAPALAPPPAGDSGGRPRNRAVLAERASSLS
ncbi:NAD(P)H-dependent oxidoreductase [Planomonospora sp. ID67723]|uniref:NADPH-dependent FMN reductase n=1 Tax=Planomonospora sp. ID67723 TaxID=2738134 RepID=UPI0018C3BD6F|nr:NAD(P)H-dependent oxidoreductase [Planomonospora sp. ID67723]MBG0830146.1 NAD(P)H-dependent oxidoreductase [Planomonospora sp. ID67723]